MSDIKERIVGAVTVMSDENAGKVWDMIQEVFNLVNAEEVDPSEEEATALKAYHNGDPEYQPAGTQAELMQRLGLE